MNGGTIATTNEDGDAPGNGYDATTVRVDAGAEFVMNGGIINNISNFTFAIDNYGTTTVNGGKVSSVHSTVSNYGTVTIEDGEFTCNGLEGITAHVIVAWDGSNTTVNGGTFDGKDNYNGFNVDTESGANVVITGGTFLNAHSGSLYGNGTIKVSGGTFFDKIAAERCEDGYCAKDNGNGTWTVSAHVYSTVVTPPTCTEDGYTTYSCDCGCGDTYVGDIVKASHSFESSSMIAPTCTEKGYTVYVCSVCKETKNDDYTDATGHNYDGQTCTKCGEKCSCNCHKSGFMGFIWKITLFFNKLFKSNKVCKCGVTHY
jgi:hypothetical protein